MEHLSFKLERNDIFNHQNAKEVFIWLVCLYASLQCFSHMLIHCTFFIVCNMNKAGLKHMSEHNLKLHQPSSSGHSSAATL